MNQLEITQQTVKELKDFSEQMKVSVEEMMLLWLAKSRHIIAEAVQSTVDDEDVTWTDEELAELLKPEKPLTGKQMVEGGFVGGWEHKNIDDPVAFLKQQRVSRRKNKFA